MISMYNQDKREQINKILEQIREKDVKFCLMQFVSIEGTPKTIGVNANHLEDIFYNVNYKVRFLFTLISALLLNIFLLNIQLVLLVKPL